jgi:hypothetical protein
MVMRISKRRDGSYIQGRENLYPRSLFWSHQLDLDVLAEMSNVIADLGGSADAFERYATEPVGQMSMASPKKRKASEYSVFRPCY